MSLRSHGGGDEAVSSIKIFWCKVFDKEEETKKSFWKKCGDLIASILRFAAFDERGALIITGNDYSKGDEICAGEYIYIGMLRVTIHLEGYGTGVWEFPGYVDRRLDNEKLTKILKLKDSEIINEIRRLANETVEPEQSYRVLDVERGAMRRVSCRPLLNVSGEVTVEYVGRRDNSQ